MPTSARQMHCCALGQAVREDWLLIDITRAEVMPPKVRTALLHDVLGASSPY